MGSVKGGIMAQKRQDRPVREPIVSTGWELFFELTHVPAAVRVGDTLYVTGHTGDAPMGIYATDAEAQIRQTFVNVTQTLAAAGFTWSDVVELTTYHVGLAK
jgi:enamine deaminase RidA (YjgF/YER057c/UK114 family)